MAKKWGKRRKASPVVVPQAFDAAFGAPAQARPSGQATRSGRAPASSTPLADQLSTEAPGVSENYVVLPRSLAEDMPLPWQQQLAALLAQFHETHRTLSWPTYRVVPSRPERLVDLDEEQLAEAGYLVELDSDGEMVYRDRTGRRVENPEETVALVPCLDPIARKPADGGAGSGKPGAAPMNIGPQPVWRATGRSGSTASPAASPAQAVPPLPPPPTAPTLTPPPATTADAPRPPAPAAATPPNQPTPPVEASDPVDSSDGEATPAAPEFGPTGDEPTEIPYRYRR